ncbi:hypothetical protein CEXT_40621 [Caerostris extrusa]|uniref:Uncharacterized protein n=1 Tax=Caerostris extrusa TaxID=172846 RepID=A0AAV4S6Q5_CAEEX|nr:hypothetical protein CEXT_40621 [Caerostris extrusa]
MSAHSLKFLEFSTALLQLHININLSVCKSRRHWMPPQSPIRVIKIDCSSVFNAFSSPLFRPKSATRDFYVLAGAEDMTFALPSTPGGLPTKT